MITRDEAPTGPLERRIRRAIEDGIPPDEAFAGRVLARIGERSPREAAEERLRRSLRGWSAAAAVVLAVLAVFAASLGPPPPANGATGDVVGGRPAGDLVLPGVLAGEGYLEEYSNEADVFVAVFSVEMTR